MRRFIVCCLLMAALSGTAYATDYTWSTVATTPTEAAFDNPVNWTQNGVPATASDRARVPAGYTSDGTVAPFGPNFDMAAGNQFVMGEFRVEGTSRYRAWRKGDGTYTFIVSDNAGQSGNWWYMSTAAPYAYGSVTPLYITWDIYGNFWHNASGGLCTNAGVIKMRGTDKAMKRNYTTNVVDIEIYGSVWDNGSAGPYTAANTLTVKSGGQILGRSSGTSRWSVRSLVLEDGQSNLPAAGANADFDFTCTRADSSIPLTVLGGVTYPQDVRVGGGYWGDSLTFLTYTWNISIGDLTVTRDLRVQNMMSRAPGSYMWLDTRDNLTDRGLTVGRDLYIGGAFQSEDNRRDYYGVRLNSSTVKVSRDIIVGTSDTANSGTMDLGSATIYLGRHLTIRGPLSAADWTLNNWSAGTSTIICDGDGTSSTTHTQTLRTQGDDGIGLHSLVVDTNGIVELYDASSDGNLLLSGDLMILKGTFRQRERSIAFNGPLHTWKDQVGTQFDDIILLANAMVQLGSNISMDNTNSLIMGSASAIYLTGFTLVADGQTYVDGAQPYWDNDAGRIYSGAIPEPGTILLLGTGLVGALGYLRRRRMV